jgi:hypothetical protein
MPKEKKTKKPRKRFSPSVQAYIRKEKARLRKQSLHEDEYRDRVAVLYKHFAKQ